MCFPVTIGDCIYKSTHVNHPCAIWVRETKYNYIWLYNHFEALSEEYSERTGKTHKSFKDLGRPLWKGHYDIPLGNLTEKPRCISNEDIRNNSDYDVYEAYRRYLCDKWQKDMRVLSWGTRGRPVWCDKFTYKYVNKKETQEYETRNYY